jgi:hypothetical protein
LIPAPQRTCMTYDLRAISFKIQPLGLNFESFSVIIQSYDIYLSCSLYTVIYPDENAIALSDEADWVKQKSRG